MHFLSSIQLHVLKSRLFPVSHLEKVHGSKNYERLSVVSKGGFQFKIPRGIKKLPLDYTEDFSQGVMVSCNGVFF